MESQRISIHLKELTKTDRNDELVVVGVPFSQGVLMSDENLYMLDEYDNILPAQFSTLAHWHDQSIKWVLAQFWATVPANGERDYTVHFNSEFSSSQYRDESNVQVEKGETLTITSPIWQLEVSKGVPGGFVKFSSKEQSISAENGVVTGKADRLEFQQGKPEKVEILENGPIRTVLRLSGRFVDTGDLDLRYTTILTLSSNSPELRWTQLFHFYGGAARINLSSLTGQWHVQEATEFRFDERDIDLNSREDFSLLQKEDLTYEWNIVDESEKDKRFEGLFVWSDKKGATGFAVRDFWQKSPAEFTLQSDGKIQFDFWCSSSRKSAVLSAGTSFRHEMFFALGDNRNLVEKKLKTFCNPLAWSFDPDYVCETRALGYLSPEAPKRCPGYENGLRNGLEKLFEQRKNDQNYYGLLNYGDWPMKEGAYGSTWTMYADNEYDAPHVLFLLFARSGRWEYFEVARTGAIHMTDVDMHCANGGMFFHGYRDSAEEHHEHRGGPGEWGHVWADGMLDYYYLTGDITALEAAKKLGDFCLRGFEGEGYAPVRRIFAGCERAVGWPLITLASLAEATEDSVYLNKCQQMVDYLKNFVNNPDAEMEVSPAGYGRGHWWRIMMQDGCKPFMVGILYEGLKRYHRLTNDETCVEVFQKSLDWLIDKMWYPMRGAFEYEFNAFNAGHRDVYPHYINLLVVDGLAYTYRLTGEKRYLQVGLQAFYSALWTLPELLGGKELGMGCRSSLDFLALLTEMQESEAHAPAGILALKDDDIKKKLTFISETECSKRKEKSVKTLLDVPFDGTVKPRFAENTEFFADLSLEVSSDGLHAVRGSSVTFSAKDNVSEISGKCQFRFCPDWQGDSQGRPYPRALIHIQGQSFTKDALSLIAFYNGLHLRVYGSDQRLTGVIETDITEWKSDEFYDIAFRWGEGKAELFIDGESVGETDLRCPFGGKFDLIRVGYRTGFWFADGWIRDLKILG